MTNIIFSGERRRCAAAFGIGAVTYCMVEILFRGYSHWTMALTGGACLSLFYTAERKLHTQKMWKRCVLGALIITTLEFFVGCIVNRTLGWRVWDYSNIRFNLLGQICPAFSIMWFFISIPAILLCRAIREYGKEKLPAA